MRRTILINVFLFVTAAAIFTGCTTEQATRHELFSSVNLETVKAGQFDNGKMWTFDFPPIDYFSQTYGFNPSKDWFEKARLAALRLPNCTASFVSEDGLVMTNHHCARSSLDTVNREGERLAENGFYAATLADERKVNALYIDQLLVIEDVTAEVQHAFDAGATENEKIVRRTAKISEIQKRYSEKYKQSAPQDSMVFNVIAFYDGGKYSLYGYKRYTDIRLVYAPEDVIAFFGGDPDNFTYPRYDFDCSFFRVYDNGKPLKTANFFRFSRDGAKEGDAVFVIGNPGSTSRLLTLSQLKYLRDYVYPISADAFGNVGSILSGYVSEHPEAKLKYMNTIFGMENSHKAITGYLVGLRDPVVMAKKKDFENKFKDAVENNAELSKKYGDPWSAIKSRQEELDKMYFQQNAYAFRGRTRSQMLNLAANIVEMAMALKGPADKLPPRYWGAQLDSTKANMFPPKFTLEVDKNLLAYQLHVMQLVFNGKNEPFNTLLGGKSPDRAAADIAATTILSSKEKVAELLAKSADEILASSDPLIAFVFAIQPQARALRAKAGVLQEEMQAYEQILGKAMYDVYGTKIPPDATFTLRIADGVVKGYEYNGTLAPPVTTFYGLYDRYYSFGMQDPWKLPDRWANPPATFKLNTPMNFVSTNDIIGGNSGSPVINKDLQVVGLIFDGNMESLPGDVIFDDTKNRSVAVHSAGLLEGLEQIYKANRIVKELRTGKIAE